MIAKSRKIISVDPEEYTYHNKAGGFSPVTMTGPAIGAEQFTLSENNRWPSKAPGQDVGGDFVTRKAWLHNNTPLIANAESSKARYTGPVYAANPNDALADVLNRVGPASLSSDLVTLGTKAIARCIPTNPVVDGSTALGELKAGIPKMVGSAVFKSKFKDARKLGDEYLNIEFGWKPLVSDVMNTAKAVMESEKILKQLERDSGRQIRRNYSFPVATQQYDSDYFYQNCWLPNNTVVDSSLYRGAGTLRVNRIYETRVRFSGAFMYHLNMGTRLRDKIDRQAAEARKLYGLELTPAVAWNLMPWSWALDWEGTMGDVLHNVSRFAQDGLVMRYGYIMKETKVTSTYSLRGGNLIGNQPYSLGLSFTATAVRKERMRATPFGFGITPTALNARQNAIVGALGLSKAPRRV